MATKRSRALAAAERIAPEARLWTKAMVERAMIAFNDIDRIPQYDEEGIRRVVRDFFKFVKRVEAGGIEKDAEPVAQAFIDVGYGWLEKNPRYLPFSTPQWTLDMVEQTVRWFADFTTGPLDRKRAIELADRLKTFERVVRNESIEAGDAATLAHAFLDHALRWMEGHPDVLDRYQAMD